MSWKGSLIKAGISSDGKNVDVFRGNLTVYGSITLTGGGSFIGAIAGDQTRSGTMTMTATDTAMIMSGAAALGLSLTGSYTTAGIQVGTNSVPIVMAAYNDYAIDINTTCAVASNSGTPVNAFRLKSTTTGTQSEDWTMAVESYTTVYSGNENTVGHFYSNWVGTGIGPLGMCSSVTAKMLLPTSCTGAFFPFYGKINFPATPYAGINNAGASCGWFMLSIGGDTGGYTNFDDNGVFMEIHNISAGSGKLLSESSATLKCNVPAAATVKYLMLSKAENCLKFEAITTKTITAGITLSGAGTGKFTDGIIVSAPCDSNSIEITGVATDNALFIDYTIAANAARAIHVDVDTSLSSGDATAVEIAHTNTTAGIVNWRALTSTLTMAANCAGPYAAYFRVATGAYQVSGLGAAFGIEMILPSVAITIGEYHGMTIDIACTASSAIGAGKHSFIKFETWGDQTAEDKWDDGANLFFLNGMTSAAGNLVSINEQTLRINIEGTSRYLMLSHAENCLTLSGDNMADGVLISGDCSDCGLEITGTCTDSAIQIATGTSAYGIYMSQVHTTSFINVPANTVVAQFLTIGTTGNGVHWAGSQSNWLVYTNHTSATPSSSTCYKFQLEAVQGEATTSGRLECFRGEVITNSTWGVAASMRGVVSQLTFSGACTYTGQGANGAIALIGSIYSAATSHLTCTGGAMYPLGLFWGVGENSSFSGGESAFIFCYTHGLGTAPESLIRTEEMATKQLVTYFLDIHGQNLTSGGFCDATSKASSQGSIKIRLGTVTYYIPIFT